MIVISFIKITFSKKFLTWNLYLLLLINFFSLTFSVPDIIVLFVTFTNQDSFLGPDPDYGDTVDTTVQWNNYIFVLFINFFILLFELIFLMKELKTLKKTGESLIN